MEKITRYWPFVRGIHRSPVNSPHKGQWRGALMFSLLCAWLNGWVNNREAGDLRRYRAHYDVIVMDSSCCPAVLTEATMLVHYHPLQATGTHLETRSWELSSTGTLMLNHFHWLTIPMEYQESDSSNGNQVVCPIRLHIFNFLYHHR